MTQPKHATSGRDGNRYYSVPDDPTHDPLLSITTVLKLGIPKNLDNWLKLTVAQAAVEDPAWREMEPADAVNYLKRAPDRIRDAAGSRGDDVHNVAEKLALGVEPSTTWLGPETTDYLPAVRRFLNEWQPEVYGVEVTVYNLELGYAGTIDMIANVPGVGMCVLDYKTSKALYPEIGLQLAAAANGEWWWNDTLGRREQIPPIVAGFGIRIGNDGEYDFVEYPITDPEMFGGFRSAFGVASWRSWSGVRGQPRTPPRVLVDRAAKLEARARRLAGVDVDAVLRLWPEGVRTFGQVQEEKRPHGVTELARIAEALSAVEVEVGLAPAAPERVAALGARIQALPADLVSAVQIVATGQGAPPLRSPSFTDGHLEIIDAATGEAEAEHEDRLLRTTHRYLDLDDLVRNATAIGVADVTKPSTFDTDLVESWGQALAAGLVAVDDVGATRSCVSSDSFDSWVAELGGKKVFADIARGCADRHRRERPRSAWAVTDDPPLFALAWCEAVNNNQPQEGTSQ